MFPFEFEACAAVGDSMSELLVEVDTVSQEQVQTVDDEVACTGYLGEATALKWNL